MRLAELVRLADRLGWAAVILGVFSACTGLWLRRKFLTALLVGADTLVAAMGIITIAAIWRSLSLSMWEEDAYRAGFPKMGSMRGMAMSALFYFMPLLGFGMARAIFPFSRWWYAGGKARLKRFVRE